MAGDEGVLVANRLDTQIPVIDQVDVAGASACPLVAVEVRAPGQPLTLLTDPVALGAALGLPDGEAGDAATLSRSLLDYSNAVVGYAADAAAPAGPGPPEPWVLVDGERVALRLACAQLPDWPVGRVSAVHAGADGTGADGTGASGPAEVDDLFALDLAAVGDTATARRGSLGRAVLVASLQRLAAGSDHAGQLFGTARAAGPLPAHRARRGPSRGAHHPRRPAGRCRGRRGRGNHRRHRAGGRRHRAGRARSSRRAPGNSLPPRSRRRLGFPGQRPSGSNEARACGWMAGSGSRPKTAAVVSWTGPLPPARPGRWR